MNMYSLVIESNMFIKPADRPRGIRDQSLGGLQLSLHFTSSPYWSSAQFAVRILRNPAITRKEAGL